MRGAPAARSKAAKATNLNAMTTDQSVAHRSKITLTAASASR